LSQGQDDWSIHASERSIDDEILAPSRVGNYHLIRRLGEGGMGIVYVARQEQPSRNVALKLMRQAVMTVEQRRRFERESHLLGSLLHPHIAQVYEAGTHKEGSLSIPYYAMELVPDAKSITEYASSKSLPRRQRIELMIQICSAIQYAHDRAILHRDLKPTNLLVGEGGSAKVIDLGVSRLMTDASIALTRTDQLVGTVAYMAPEQLSGTLNAPTVQADVYSLGMVLYELVVGQLPYHIPSDNPVRAALAIEKAAPTRPSSLDPTITSDLEAVLLKAIEKDVANRYASVSELQRDLEHLLQGTPVSARASYALIRVLHRTRRFARAHPALVLVLIVLFWFAICFFTPFTQLTKRLDTAWPAFALGNLNYVPDVPMRHVQMVSLRSDLKATAAALGNTTYDPANIPSARPLLGRLVERLALAKPKAIALDYAFGSPSPYDSKFLESLKNVEDSGIQIITCSNEWTLKGGPGVLPELASRHRVGMPGVAEVYGNNYGLITMMIDEVNGNEPTFVTHAIAAGLGIPRDAALYIDYHQTIQAQLSPSDKRALAPVSLLQGGPTGSDFELAIAANVVEVPTDRILEDSDIDFDAVFRMSDSILRTTFADKVVMVGDARPGRDPPIEVLPGRRIVGYQLNALVAEQALGGRHVRWLGQTLLFGFSINTEIAIRMVGFALLAAASIAIRSTRQLAASSAVFTMIALLAPIIAYQFNGVIFRTPSALLYPLLLLPILYGARRWSAREHV
jgi:hypothetical protein